MPERDGPRCSAFQGLAIPTNVDLVMHTVTTFQADCIMRCTKGMQLGRDGAYPRPKIHEL
jgi:hypothetical protein